MCPRIHPLSKPPAHLRTGADGEHAALRLLRMRGYRLIARNVRIGHDEIDLIAFDPAEDVIVFVEVKTRSADDEDFDPELNFTGGKRQKFRRAGRRWVDREEYEGGYRFDVMYVTAGRVMRHIQDLVDEE